MPWDGDVLEDRSQPQNLNPHTSNTAKSVGFAAVGGAAATAATVGLSEKSNAHNNDDNDEEDEDSLLREVDPIPERDGSGLTAEQQGRVGLEYTRGLDLGQSLDESAEWARASDDDDEDEQSEEYDEDEQLEGEELDFDQ
jgi:peroxin-2